MTRKYHDREVGIILRRALEPTPGSQDPEATGADLTLEQIKDIAAEVGIDPARVEVAAASLIEPERASPNPYAGIPTTLQLQTTLPDRALEPGDLPEYASSGTSATACSSPPPWQGPWALRWAPSSRPASAWARGASPSSPPRPPFPPLRLSLAT